MKRAKVVVTAIAVASAVIVAGIVLGLTVMRRAETGEWSVPDSDDLVRIKRVLDRDQPPTRLIYLHRGAIELTGGTDDAARGVSSVVDRGARVTAPGFSGSNRQWRSIVSCVERMFQPYEVRVTDALPTADDYLLVAVGGKASQIGHGDRKSAGGLAPFAAGKAIPNAVVFAFSDRLNNQPQRVCDVIAMEVGHAYGLDHGYDCKDVMTYLKPCGRRKFMDRDVRCGEGKPRDCADGQKTQNSHRHLLELLGARTVGR